VTARAARLLLWLGALVLLPVPVLVFGPGSVPAARLAGLGGVGLAIAIAESARGNVLQIASVLLVQAALWAAGLWLAAWLAARVLSWLAPRALGRATLGLLAVALALACALPIYDDPFAARQPRVTLLRVYR
jgi:hypothetical protein